MKRIFRPMDENGGLDGDFKMLPAPVSLRQEAFEPLSEGQTGQLPASRPAPRVEEKGAEESDFKNRMSVYQAIVEHQRDADWWLPHDDLEMLREKGHIFIKAFNLKVKDATYMGMPLIRIESMNVKTVGMYRPEADGYAIPGTIALNGKRLPDLPDFMKLALFMKLLLCARQHQAGGDGTFDSECRERMKSAGLVITEKGAITIDEDGLFRHLLKECGIDIPVASVFPRPSREARSTNQLWSCTCQKARVGTKEFFAVCPKCNEPFRLGDHVGKRFVKTDEAQALARV